MHVVGRCCRCLHAPVVAHRIAINRGKRATGDSESGSCPPVGHVRTRGHYALMSGRLTCFRYVCGCMHGCMFQLPKLCVNFGAYPFAHKPTDAVACDGFLSFPHVPMASAAEKELSDSLLGKVRAARSNAPQVVRPDTHPSRGA